MKADREQSFRIRAILLAVVALAGCLLLHAGNPLPAFATNEGALAEGASNGARAEAVEVSAEGSAASLADCAFALADFTRVEKGSNRAIDGTYHGYCYLMDSPEDSLCVVDLTSTVVVYVPESMVQAHGLDLDDGKTQENLRLLVSALDSYDAEGNTAVKSDVPWYFTSQTRYTIKGITIGFSQEYQPGLWYTSVLGEDGSDVTDASNPLGLDSMGLRLSHVDYASIQQSDEVAIAAEPTAFEKLGAFFATLDWSPLWVTLKTTGTALVFIFFLGLLAAWWTLRLSPRAQSVVDAILTIPLVLPPTVCGFILLLCLGRNTPIGAWFDQIGFPLVFSWQATVIAAFVVAFPLMYRSARGAFESIDTDMLDAARTLGWSEGRIFFRLMLPLAWSSIAAGTMLAFARALGEFGATLFLAGNYVGITRTIPIAIYFEWMGGNIEAALFWTIVVIIVSFAVICALNLWSKRTTSYRRKEADA